MKFANPVVRRAGAVRRCMGKVEITLFKAATGVPTGVRQIYTAKVCPDGDGFAAQSTERAHEIADRSQNTVGVYTPTDTGASRFGSFTPP